MGVAKFTHHTVGSFLRKWNFFVLQLKEGKHCQPSSTSVGLVDRFKVNYSATGRANSFANSIASCAMQPD